MALDASGELTARQQDKCLLLGRSGKTRRASVRGFVCRRCLCCRRRCVALDTFWWQVVGWLLSSIVKKISGTEINFDARFLKRNLYCTLRNILTHTRALNLYIKRNSYQTSVGEFRDW